MTEEPTMYHIINKSEFYIRHYRNPRDVSIFMLGRRVKEYIVVKSDENGDRVVNFHDCEISAIEKSLIES